MTSSLLHISNLMLQNEMAEEILQPMTTNPYGLSWIQILSEEAFVHYTFSSALEDLREEKQQKEQMLSKVSEMASLCYQTNPQTFCRRFCLL